MASHTDTPPLRWRISVPVPATGTTVVATSTQEHFLCSSDPALIQLDALHEALASDLLWWAKPLARPQLAAMVANSVCLAIYRVNAEDDDKTQDMVGFARLITDRITFAYLTDVYILPVYQRRGLGAWMMRCLRELCEGSGPDREGSTPTSPGWPDLRGLWLVASTPATARMYMGALGAEEAARYRARPGEPGSGMILVEMPGPANSIRHHSTKNGTGE